MNALQRLKSLKQLKALYAQKQGEQKPLARLSIIKQIKAIRKELGLKNRPNPQNDTSRKERTAQITEFFKDNLLGKSIIASDGNKITFNRKQSDHLIHDGRISDIAFEAVKRVVDVFETGEPTGKQTLTHERNKDNFIAFYGYVKYLDIGGYRCLVEAKAGLKADSDVLEVPLQTIAYSSNVYEKLKNATSSLQEADQAGNLLTDSIDNSFRRIEISQARSSQSGVMDNHNLMLDKLQADYQIDELAMLTILDIEPLKRQNELRLDLGVGSKNKPVERKQIVVDDVAIQAQKLNGSPVANIDENTLNMPKEGGFKAITEWGKQIFNSWGGKANNPVLGEVILNEQSIRDSLSHDKKFNPYKGFALASVKDVVEKGSIIHTDYNTPGEDSFYIAAPVLINGNRNIVTVLVHRDVNTQRMYLHYVGLEENLKQSHYKQTAAQDKESRKHNRNATASDIANILQNALNYKQDNAELTNNKQDGWDGNDKIPQNSQPFNRTNIKIPKSIKARQNANNKSFA